MHERAVELASKGHRFSDLRRWGLAEDMLAGKVEKVSWEETCLPGASRTGITCGLFLLRK